MDKDSSNEKVIRTLNELIQLDVDAVGAFTKVIKEIDFPEARHLLTSFRADHERHIEDLSREVMNLGGAPTTPTRDLRGLIIEGAAAIRSMMGTEGALKAVRSNEEITNRKYAAALEANLPPSALEVVKRHQHDEASHLDYVETALKTRSWEVRRAAG